MFNVTFDAISIEKCQKIQLISFVLSIFSFAINCILFLIIVLLISIEKISFSSLVCVLQLKWFQFFLVHWIENFICSLFLCYVGCSCWLWAVRRRRIQENQPTNEWAVLFIGLPLRISGWFFDFFSNDPIFFHPFDRGVNFNHGLFW